MRTETDPPLGGAAVPAEPHLALRRLRAGYSGTPVVHDVDLELQRGEFGVLLGANGAGKTTTLRAIMGLAEVIEGEVVLAGETVTRMPTPELVRRRVALVPEGRELFASLPVEDNLAAGTLVAGRQRQRKRLEYVLDTFPVLGERLHQTAGTLSGGEQQMLAIGRALMSDPELLLVDEASLGLAPTVVDKVLDLVSTVNRRGVTVLAVEQNLAVLDHAHVACVLEAGAVELAGRVTEIADRLHGDIAAAYLGGSP